MTEQWRSITGFESRYEVSDLGRVRALPCLVRTALGKRSHRGGIMSPVLDKDGYPRVILRVAGKHYTRKVHRLVAEAFHGDKKNALHNHVDHIDRDRANARADNLHWVSHGENRARSRGTPAASKKITAADARAILEAKGTLPASHYARQYSVSVWLIYKIWKGRRWSWLTSNSSRLRAISSMEKQS